MNEFYVYELIDPRTNSVFYIGKGKGKRVFQHLNEKQKFNTNTEKLKIIKGIKEENLEVGHILIGENLSENASLLLERLLIYRLGRRIFEEGVLTNIVPGGKWAKEESLFLKETDLPTDEIINSEFSELIPILENYPHVAVEFKWLGSSDNNKCETLYNYDINGKILNEYNLHSFLTTTGLDTSLDVINAVRNTCEPVYAYKQLWSKNKLRKTENISKIPFQDFDIVDFEFVIKVNELLLKRVDFISEGSYPDGNKRTEIKFISNSKEVLLTYYFPDNNKKHLTKYVEGKLEGTCLIWYPNGLLKEEIQYSQDNRIGKMCYYPNGNIKKSSTQNEDGSTITKDWYQNGQLRRVFKMDATISPLPSTFQTSLSPLEIGSIWTYDYSESGILIRETKENYPNGLGNIVCGFEKLFYDTGELKTLIEYAEGSDKKTITTYQKNGEKTPK